jgi:hypothetical protein
MLWVEEPQKATFIELVNGLSAKNVLLDLKRTLFVLFSFRKKCFETALSDVVSRAVCNVGEIVYNLHVWNSECRHKLIIPKCIIKYTVCAVK